jgi:hypothetical protein
LYCLKAKPFGFGLSAFAVPRRLTQAKEAVAAARNKYLLVYFLT